MPTSGTPAFVVSRVELVGAVESMELFERPVVIGVAGTSEDAWNLARIDAAEYAPADVLPATARPDGYTVEEFRY